MAFLYYEQIDKHLQSHLNGKICEFKWDKNNNVWNFHKIREDRTIELSRGNYYGNNFTVAENIWQSYENPINIIDLYSELSEDYFKEHDNPLYKSLRSFNSYSKVQLLDKIKNSSKTHNMKTVIDIGSGKGQDLRKYVSLGIEHVVFVDIDASALEEIVSRKHQMSSPLKISIVLTDVNNPSEDTIAKIKQHLNVPASLIVCNMSVHYFTDTFAHIQNYVNLVSQLLAENGSLLITSFNGQKVFDLLANETESPNGHFSSHEKNILKYSIIKEYKSDKLEIGQKIRLILPFSNGEYYEETLVNYNELISAFSKKGIKKNKVFSFTDFYSNYQYKTFLTPQDIKFIDLYGAIIFVK